MGTKRKEKKEKKEKKPKSKFRSFLEWAIIVVAACVFCFSAYQLYLIYSQNSQEADETESLQDLVDAPTSSEELDTFSIDFDELLAINEDIVGWIIVEDTDISYPIVQGDDNEYYLDHTYYGTSNYAGAIFMDYRASSDFSDLNTFIYGHNVYHGTMFAELANYMDEDFFNSHPYVYLYTPSGNYKLQVFSAYVEEASSDSYKMSFSSLDAFAEYLELVTSKSVYETDVTVTSSDRIVTLYTCSYESGNNPTNTEDSSEITERYFIHCKLIEVLEVDAQVPTGQTE